MNTITGHYVAMTRRNNLGDDYVTFVLGPFASFDAMAAAGPAFVNWYRGKYPGDHEAVLEAVSYSAGRLPLGRCNADYGFRPFDGPAPIPLFGR